MPLDCRNLLVLPRERRTAIFTASPTLQGALTDGLLFPVNATNLTSYGFPCCRVGGPCCRNPRDSTSCCMPNVVSEWWRSSTSSHGEKSGVMPPGAALLQEWQSGEVGG